MIFLIILLVIICVALGLFVLIQNPKGGGLQSGASAGSNMFGVQRTGDVLEKGTWVLLALVVVLTLSISMIAKNGSTGSGSSKIQEQLDRTPTPSTSPINQNPANTPQPANPKP